MKLSHISIDRDFLKIIFFVFILPWTMTYVVGHEVSQMCEMEEKFFLIFHDTY